MCGDGNVGIRMWEWGCGNGSGNGNMRMEICGDGYGSRSGNDCGGGSVR